MGIMPSTYALRISNVVKPTMEDPNGRRIIFAFGGGFKVPTDCHYVEISFNMGRLVFRFLRERYPIARTSVMKRVCKLTKNSTNSYVTSSTLKGFVELMEGWEGEYDEMLKFPSSKPEEYKFYIKRDMRHLYTILQNGSTAIVHPSKKEPDILEEDAKQASVPYDISYEKFKEIINKDAEPISIPIDETKPSLGEAMEKFTNNVKETLNKVVYGEPKEEPDISAKFDEALLDMRQREYDLCKDVVQRAEECTRIMANGVITLLEFRLLRRPLSIGEAEANVEFHKIYLKYLKLENAIKDLMTNVRHTWEDGHKLYDAYKKTKEDYPDMDDKDIASYLHVGPEELQETVEAIKHLEEERKEEKAKIGFTVED